MRQVGFPFVLFLLFGTFVIGAAAQTDPPAQGVKTPVKIIKKPQASARGCQKGKGSSGVARLRVTLDKSGSVTDVNQVRSSGCDSFDRSAISAAKKIEFEPAQLNGEAITVVRVVEYKYSFY